MFASSRALFVTSNGIWWKLAKAQKTVRGLIYLESSEQDLVQLAGLP